MITLNTIPKVNLVRNSLPITFLSDNYKESSGIYPYKVFKLTSLPAAGNTFVIAFGNYSFLFIIAADPADDPQFIEASEAGESITDYTNSKLVPGLQANREFSELASVTNTNDEVTITLLEKANSPITFTPNGFTTQDIYGSNGNPDVYRENFKINFEIYDYDTNEIISNVRSLEPDENGKLIVDIQQLVEGHVKSSFVFNSDNVAEVLPNDIKRIYIKYWESYGIGTDYTQRKTKNGQMFRIIDGAISYIEQGTLNEQGKKWIDSIEKHKWLTNKPIVSSILPEQKILLKLFVGETYTPIKLSVLYTFNDESTSKVQFDIDSNNYRIHQFDVSPKRLNISTTVLKYDVYIEAATGGEALSDVITFNIDRKFYNNIRQYFFRNSLGGFDTIQGLGIGKTDADYKRERVTAQKPINHTRSDREIKTVSVDEQLEFKTNLGFGANWGEGKHAWANYIRQLYNAIGEVYEIINDVNYPIDITTDKANLIDDNNQLPDYALDYTRAYVDRGAPSKIPALQGAYTNQYTEQYD